MNLFYTELSSDAIFLVTSLLPVAVAIALYLFLTMISKRECVWKLLVGNQFLSVGKKTFIWKKMVALNSSDQYWTLVLKNLQRVQCRTRSGQPAIVVEILTKELRDAVECAPMDYLLAYIRSFYRVCYDPAEPLYDEMLAAIKARMEEVDFRVSIALSMATTSDEALSIFESIRSSSEIMDVVELPAL